MKAALYQIAKISIISCCIFFMPSLSSAQTRGTVEVVKDPLIDTLIAKRPTLVKVSPVSEESSSGYRVQIFFGSNRQSAYAAQAKFRDEYPEYRTYISYNDPNFRVQAGDFHTRLEAQKLMSELTQSFTSLFIIPGKINPNKTDTPQ
jgi:hypothetical protein